MNIYRITIKPLSAFGTPLVGDTLFGQLCWAVQQKWGEARLTELLEGYTEQRPFMVISDAFPHQHLPLPHLPSNFWETSNQDRKVLKKKQWISLTDSQQAVKKWQTFAKAENALLRENQPYKTIQDQPHNSISRQLGTTSPEFAPYSSSQIWYGIGATFDLYVVLDESRFHLEEFTAILTEIGKLGYGRDTSIGLGRFDIINTEPFAYPTPNNANAYLALANTAPQGLGLDKARCYYQITTRFGRHGSLTALSANPFKKPIILTKAGAVFTPKEWQDRLFIGNGLGNVSYAQPQAVHQGYAPVIPLAIEFDG